MVVYTWLLGPLLWIPVGMHGVVVHGFNAYASGGISDGKSVNRVKDKDVVPWCRCHCALGRDCCMMCIECVRGYSLDLPHIRSSSGESYSVRGWEYIGVRWAGGSEETWLGPGAPQR